VPLTNGGVVSGATTATLTLTGISSGDYGSYDVVVTDAQSMSITSNTVTLADVVTDWANRVVTNGGAAPSAGTKTALTTFYAGLVSDGLTGKIKAMCCFVPDNLIAAITPLVRGVGSDPWTNTNFVSGDLTVDGLKGNGSNKYLTTGVAPSAAFASVNDGGLTTFCHSPGQCNSGIEMGVQSASGLSNMYQYVDYLDGYSYFSSYGQSTGRLNVFNPSWNGYISGNRTASNATAIYIANVLVPHATLGTATGVPDQGLSANPLFCFAYNNNGSPLYYSNRRLSFSAIHSGFTSSESAAFYARVKQLRIDLGGGYGGFQTTDDIVNTWSAQVVTNGGAAPSAGTITALKTFLAGLQTDGILSSIRGMCCFVPDNLIAATTPLIPGDGNVLWTNHNFVSGDLSVNGLLGNGSTKYLETGLIPANLFGSAALSGGLTVYNYTGNNLGSTDIGAQGSAYNVTDMNLYVNWSDGNTYGDCFGAGTGRVTAPNSAWAGYTSLNRTASNAIAIYKANSGVAHTTLVSGTGASDQVPGPQQLFCFATNGNGSPQGYSSKRLSFAAAHLGLTSAQSANFYSRIQTLRTSLGGGYL
jgi:hypothetical protein